MIEDERYGKLCLMTEVRNIDYFHNRPAWFLDKKLAGGGIIMNYGAHTLDKLFYLLGEDVERVYGNIDNKVNDASIEAQAQMLIKMKNGVSASFSYCASHLDYMYETYFYFTNAVAKITGGKFLSVSGKGIPTKNFELDYDKVPIEEQFDEFVKLLQGKEANIVDASRGKKVISVIEEVFNQNK